MFKETNFSRRRFLGVAAMSVTASEFVAIGSANAQSNQKAPAGAATIKPDTFKPGTNTSFGPLKQIDAGILNVGYAEAGPAMVRR